MDILIRDFQKEDLQNMHSLHKITENNYCRSYGDIKNPQPVYLQPGCCLLVALVNKEFAASGALIKKDSKTAELGRIRVHKKFRGKGIGKSILFALEKRAAKLGYSKIILDSAIENKAAHQMYIKYGYKEYKRGRQGKFFCIFYEKTI